MVAFAELDLEARTDSLKKAQEEIRKIGVEGDKAETKVKKATEGISGGMNKLASAAGLVVGLIVSMQTAMAAVTAARQFDAALAETSTLLAGNAAQMKIVEDGARSMAREFGGNATSQVQAYYQAISAGAGDAAAATKLLDSANKLAKGGITDVTTAVDVLTTATNAYKASGLTSAAASDALFVGMKAGKTTITELSAAVGGVLPLAVSLGVSFDETVAAMSALTTQGISTAQSATGVRAALTSMIAPTEEAQKLAKALGIEFNAAGVKANGFGGVMDQIIAKTGGNTEAIQKLFGSVEATTAALSFAGGAGTVYADIMDKMAEKSGATSEAFELVADSLDSRLNVVLARGGDMLLGLGNIMLAGLVPALEMGVALIDATAGSMQVFGVLIAGLAATQIPALILALGAKAAALLAGASAAGIATVAMTALNAAVVFLGGPLGIALGLIGGAAAYFLLFRDNAGEAETAAYDAAAGTAALNGVLDGFYQTAAPSAGKAAIALANDNYKLADSAYEAAKAEMAKQKAMLQSASAAYEANFHDIEGASMLGYEQDKRVLAYTSALEKLNSAENALEQARSDRRRSVTAVTGADYGGDPTLPKIPDISGGGGKGGGASDGFKDKLEALTRQFETERELADRWYAESQTILADRRAMEILGAEEHARVLLLVEEELQRRKAEIRDQDLSHYESFFGAMAGALQSGGDRMLKISKGFALAEAAVSIWRGAAKALELPFPANLAAWGQVIATGAKALSGIKSASFGGGSVGGSGGSGGSREATSEPAQQDRIVRLDVRGEGMFADMLRESGAAIVDAITNEGKYGGTTVVMGR